MSACLAARPSEASASVSLGWREWVWSVWYCYLTWGDKAFIDFSIIFLTKWNSCWQFGYPLPIFPGWRPIRAILGLPASSMSHMTPPFLCRMLPGDADGASSMWCLIVARKNDSLFDSFGMRTDTGIAWSDRHFNCWFHGGWEIYLATCLIINRQRNKHRHYMQRPCK